MEKYYALSVGLGLVALGVFSIYSYHKKLRRFQETGLRLTATIAEITGSISHRRSAWVVFTAPDTDREIREFKVRLDHFSSAMKVGKKVTLYVNPDDPHEVFLVWKSQIVVGVIFILAGIAFPALWWCF